MCCILAKLVDKLMQSVSKIHILANISIFVNIKHLRSFWMWPILTQLATVDAYDASSCLQTCQLLTAKVRLNVYDV